MTWKYWILAGFLLMCPRVLWAEAISDTNALFLYGAGFHNSFYSLNTQDGLLSTLELVHFGTWKYGANYFLLDTYYGKFVRTNNEIQAPPLRMFGKWQPRISLANLSGSHALSGIIKDCFVIGELAWGSVGFWADQVGVGLSYNLPGDLVLLSNFFLRKDTFNSFNYQISMFWFFPFQINNLPFLFLGFADFKGTDAVGIDIHTQPQLLVDLGYLINHRKSLVHLGMAWFFDRNDAIITIGPQVALRWQW